MDNIDVNEDEISNPQELSKSISDAHEFSQLARISPADKDKLMKLMKKDEEFTNPLETAIVKLLMGEVLNLEELGIVMGLASKKTGGKPMSKVAAKKEIDRIVAVMAKRSKSKIGRSVDLNTVKQKVRDMKKADAEKAKQRKADVRELKKRTAAAVADYEKTKRELKQARTDAGLPQQPIPSIYNQHKYGQDTDERGSYKNVRSNS